MLRVALLGIVTIACACHRKDDASASETGSAAGGAALVANAAGIVRELSGKVTVAGKPVAVGDRLGAGDVVTTGEGSRVVIELIHNGAKWEIGPNRSERVADSIAWKMTRAEAATMGVVVRDMTQPSAAEGSSAPAAQPPQGAAAALMVHRGALMKCLDASTQSVQLMVHIDATGKAKTDAPGASEAIRACLVREVNTLKFPPQEAGVGITLEK